MWYTVLPISDQPDNATKREIRDVRVGDRWLKVEVHGDNKGVVLSMFSSSPSDYLNPKFQPGQTVRLDTLQQ